MNETNKNQIELINRPLRLRRDKVAEMREIFIQAKTKSRAVFLDLDGTIADLLLEDVQINRYNFGHITKDLSKN